MYAFIFSIIACIPATESVDDSAAVDDSAGSELSEFDGAACFAYHGFQSASSRWVYEYDGGMNSDESYYVTEVVAYDTDAGTAQILTRHYRVVTNTGAVQDNSYLVGYSCTEEGLSIVDQDAEWKSITSDGTTSSGTSTLVYEPPLLVRPNDLVVGDTWQASSVRTGESSSSGEAVLEIEQDWFVDAEGVPSGDYEAFRLIGTYNGGDPYEDYFTPQVGLPIRPAGLVLVVYTP